MAVVTVFRSRLRADAGDAFVELAAEMLELARSMPCFRDYKAFTADDGERVSIIVFDSLEAQEAWRDNVEHRAAQERGRRSFYESYRIQVCELLNERAFTRPAPA